MHGALRPWQIDTTNRKRFSDLVKPANAGSPATCAELQKQLQAILSDFPAEQKILADSPPTAKAVVRPAFYEIELPKPYDVFTQFYSHIITKEALRASNLLIQENETHTNETDIRYNAKQALKSIKRLIKKTADELRESGYATFPDSNSEFKHFVLFTLKQMLSALFFDVQERYRNVLSDFETEESFCLTVLNESYSGTPQLKPTAAFFEYQMQHILSENKFSAPAAVNLLKQIQTLQDAKLQSMQGALENLIFLRSANAQKAKITLERLTNPDLIKEHFSKAKESITQEINQLDQGYLRLEVVNTALSELDYIQPTPINKLSVPQKLYFWLQENKNVYTTTASQFYAVEPDVDAELRKGGKPLQKKAQATLEAQKQVAFEHLKFMSGVNRLNQKIMPDADFNKLTGAVAVLIDTGNTNR